VTPLHRIKESLSPAALLVAVLALVLAATGAGYAAATIGTNDIKNDAVTSPKVKNGTLKAADMVKDGKYKAVTAGGPPNFSNGGEGDCAWIDGAALLAGIAKVSYRKDRFGTVHLTGLAASSSAGGGDGVCDASGVGESEDGIVFTLPKDAAPAKTQLIPIGTIGIVVVAGKAGLIGSGLSVPPRAVYWAGSGSSTVLLDGITFETASSKAFGRTAATSGRIGPRGEALLRSILR
jgi:hypothetical protein